MVIVLKKCFKSHYHHCAEITLSLLLLEMCAIESEPDLRVKIPLCRNLFRERNLLLISAKANGNEPSLERYETG